jgi:CheY-like chemotaxis protein
MQTYSSQSPRIVHIEDSDSDAQFFDFAVSSLETPVDVVRFTKWKAFEEYSNTIGSNKAETLPDLIIMDHDVDGTDAVGLITLIRKSDTLRLIPIIVFSGYDYDQAINSYYLAGASSYIRKPLSIDETIVILKSIVNYWFTVNRGPKSR